MPVAGELAALAWCRSCDWQIDGPAGAEKLVVAAHADHRRDCHPDTTAADIRELRRKLRSLSAGTVT